MEVLDLPASVLEHFLAKCFLRYRKTDSDDCEPYTLLGLQRGVPTEVPFRRQVSFHCPFTI